MSEKPELKLTAEHEWHGESISNVRLHFSNDHSPFITLDNKCVQPLLSVINSHDALLKACKELKVQLKNRLDRGAYFSVREREGLNRSETAIRAAEPEKTEDSHERKT